MGPYKEEYFAKICVIGRIALFLGKIPHSGKNMTKRLLSLFLLVPLLGFPVKGQDDEEDDGGGGGSLPAAFNKGAVGVSGGSMLFYGDLAGYYVLPRLSEFDNTFKTGYRVFIKRKVKWGLGGRLGFTKGKLQGGHRNGRGA